VQVSDALSYWASHCTSERDVNLRGKMRYSSDTIYFGLMR
jgi:hypothetical protein